jgi:hypothetical protein
MAADDEFDDWLREEYPVSIADVVMDTVIVFQTLDPDGYREKALEWRDDRNAVLLARASEVLDFKTNRDRFERLRDLISEGVVVPVIGAGMSVPCGVEGWTAFLRNLATHLDDISPEALACLDEGRLEDGGEIIATELGEDLFIDQVGANLRMYSGAIRGAVRLLPQLFDGPVVTTNLERVIEDVFARADMPFDDVISDGPTDSFAALLLANYHMLFKLHGDVVRPETWVLRTEGYEGRYGPRGEPELGLPLPSALTTLYKSRSLLFLGCSLTVDRTIEVFEEVRKNSSPLELPTHFAIVERPADDADWSAREKFLTERHVFPIWFGAGDYQAVEIFLLALSV